MFGFGFSASGFTDPGLAPGLLDFYPATAAYSLRKLRHDYTGAAIRVRRDSDNAEQDIGFSGLDLDTAALTSFCTGTNGFVVTWYDQSGNSNDATQATAGSQPKIYDSSTGVVLKNGKPALDFDGAGDLMTATISGMQNFTNLSLFTTISPDIASAPDSGTQVIFGYANGGGTTSVKGLSSGSIPTSNILGETYTILFSNDTISAGRLGSSTYSHSAGEQILHTNIFASTGTNVYKNGNQINLDLNNVIDINSDITPSNCDIANDLFHIASINGIVGAVSQMVQETIVYNTNQSANRTEIEANINDYYNIYP